MRRLEIKTWEKVLIVLSALLFSGAFALYITDFPVRKYLFGLRGDGGERKVGILSSKAGLVRRQISGDAEFRAMVLYAPLYDDDVIVTGDEGLAGLTLDDGGKIDLAANTMVRLRYETLFGLGGISRTARVEVVAGQVSGESKARRIIVKTRERETPIEKNLKLPIAQAPRPSSSPMPTPIPTPDLTVELIHPTGSSRLNVDSGSAVAQKVVTFEWKTNRRSEGFLLMLKQIEPTLREILRRPVRSREGIGSFQWTIKNPGSYVWELRTSQGEEIKGLHAAQAPFIVERDFESIHVLEPWVGGESGNSNLLKNKVLKNFDLTLRWRRYSYATQYQVWLASSPQAEKPLLERTVTGTEFQFNRDRIHKGPLYYRISAALPNGFRVFSPMMAFQFHFLPPVLVLPKDKSEFQQSQLTGKNKALLMTWQRTNFTESYEIEIAEDAEFSNTLLKKMVKENFFAFKPSGPGTYWWRVKAFAKGAQSNPSGAFQVKIDP